MAVLSVLCRNACKRFAGIIRKPASAGVLCINPAPLIMKDAVRQMSEHKKLFVVTASRFQWKKFKDEIHYYVMLGAIPLGLLILYVNIFIGPAELREIPEGYEPENWEYYRHPIQRWFARYFYTTEQEHYEKTMHFLTEQEELRHIKVLELQVKRVMASKDDYKAWYYKPITGKYHRLTREENEKLSNEWSGQE